MQCNEEKTSRNIAVVAMYQAGGTIRDLAVEFEVTPQRIQQIIRAQGKPLRPRTWRKGRAERKMAVCEMRAGGASIAAIVAKLHISGSTIEKMLDAVTLPDIPCKECGQMFIPTSVHQRFCCIQHTRRYFARLHYWRYKEAKGE